MLDETSSLFKSIYILKNNTSCVRRLYRLIQHEPSSCI